MATEAWFLRSDTGKYFPISEHRDWIEQPQNARTVGVPESVIAEFPRRKGRDRCDFLRWAFKNSPNLVRVRNHGIYTSFEAWKITTQTLKAIHRMCQQIGVGDCLLLVISELRPHGKEYREFWVHFDEKMKTGKRLKPVEETR